uniref:Core Histone H2A/H2B/H3 domain-containing protein n=1 Tax=Leersia perrieri TaxID=77586 RepID=A0A0D9XH29_9ORYZ
MAPRKKKAAVKKVKVVASAVKTTVVQVSATELEMEVEAEPPISKTSSTSVQVVQVEAEKTPSAPPVVSLQSQETQDLNEDEEPTAAEKNKLKKATTTAAAEHKKRNSKKKKKRNKGVENGGYKRYVWRVLKQLHPDLGMSSRTMDVLDMMMADMFERLAEEASRLSKISGRATLTSREVQTAVRLVLPGDLANHAISEATKAISKYLS